MRESPLNCRRLLGGRTSREGILAGGNQRLENLLDRLDALSFAIHDLWKTTATLSVEIHTGGISDGSLWCAHDVGDPTGLVYDFATTLPARRAREWLPSGSQTFAASRPLAGASCWCVDATENEHHMMMPPQRHAERQANLLNLLRETDVDAMLVTGVSNVTYLTGFSGDSSALLIGPSVRVLISDSRYQTQIAEECPGLEADIRTQKTKQPDQIASVVSRAKPAKLALESHIVTADEFARLSDAIGKTDSGKSIEIKPLASVVEKLRQVKDEFEIAETRQAIKIAEQGFQAFRSIFLSADDACAVTEKNAAHSLEHLMRSLGADRAAFDIIVAVGDRSALPHYRAGERRISEAPFVLIDWGAALPSGYRSDLTRVLATGTVPDQLQELHGVVLKAQLAGIAAIRPGAKLKDVDAAARRVIEEAGFGEFFGHGLGHGIGLHIHEEPRLSSVAEGELQPGNIVTVEPGIYLPNFGGVRIEDDVLVTPDGHEVLSSLPKSL